MVFNRFGLFVLIAWTDFQLGGTSRDFKSAESLSSVEAMTIERMNEARKSLEPISGTTRPTVESPSRLVI